MHVRCCRSAVVCEEDAAQHDPCLSAALLRAALGWMDAGSACCSGGGGAPGAFCCSSGSPGCFVRLEQPQILQHSLISRPCLSFTPFPVASCKKKKKRKEKKKGKKKSLLPFLFLHVLASELFKAAMGNKKKAKGIAGAGSGTARWELPGGLTRRCHSPCGLWELCAAADTSAALPCPALLPVLPSSSLCARCSSPSCAFCLAKPGAARCCRGWGSALLPARCSHCRAAVAVLQLSCSPPGPWLAAPAQRRHFG